MKVFSFKWLLGLVLATAMVTGLGWISLSSLGFHSARSHSWREAESAAASNNSLHEPSASVTGWSQGLIQRGQGSKDNDAHSPGRPPFEGPTAAASESALSGGPSWGTRFDDYEEASYGRFGFRTFNRLERLQFFGAAQKSGTGGMEVAKSEVGQVAYSQPLQLLSTTSDGTCVSRSFTTWFSFVIEGPAFGTGTSRRVVGPVTSSTHWARAGLAFALVPNLETRGLKGLHMGYGNPGLQDEPASLAIEFDTHRSREVHDINSNHVGLNLNRTMESVAVADVSLVTQLADGQLKYCWVHYNASLSKTSVYMSDWPSRPLLPILQASLDLCHVLSQPTMFASFCASNEGRGREAYLVKSWHWEFEDGQPLRFAGEGAAEARGRGAEELARRQKAQPLVELGAHGGRKDNSTSVETSGGAGGQLGDLRLLEKCGELGTQLHSANFIPPNGQPLVPDQSTVDPKTRTFMGFVDSPKFLAIGQLEGQLTYMKHQLGEFLALAKALNRTIVLPSCGGGRCGVFPASRLPACTYFDIHLISHYVPWVTEAYLEEVYVKESRQAPTMLVVNFVDNGRICDRCIKVMSACKKLEELSPNFSSRVNKSHISRAIIDGVHPYKCITNKQKGIQVKKVKTLGRSADVIIMSKQTSANLFSGELDKEKETARKHLRIAPSIFKMAKEMAQKHLEGGRYLALYWQMEESYGQHMDPQRRRECATGLLETAKRVMAANKLTSVFMVRAINVHSNALKSDHTPVERTVREIKEAMTLAQEIRLALAPVTWDNASIQFSSLDTGIQSLLEQVECAMASIFLYAPPECHQGNTTMLPEVSTHLIDILNIRKFLKQPSGTQGPWKTVNSKFTVKDPHMVDV